MARRGTLSEKQYRQIIKGGNGALGLRSIANGFDASSGYDLRKPLTKSQKARVRKYHKATTALTAQPKTILRPRSQKKADALGEMFHYGLKGVRFKVGFVPYTAPVGVAPTSAKFVQTVNGFVIENDYYKKQFIPFNQRNLARDHAKEVRRVIALTNGAQYFYVQCGEHENLIGTSANGLIERVGNYIAKYSIPNSGADWRKWLAGVQCYTFKRPDNFDQLQLENSIKQGRKAYQEKRKRTRARLRKAANKKSK